MKMILICAALLLCGFQELRSAKAVETTSCSSPVSAVVVFKDGKKKEIFRDAVMESLSSSERLSQQPWEVAYSIAVKQQILDTILQKFTDEKACTVTNEQDYKKNLERVKREFLRNYLLQKLASASVTDASVKQEYDKAKKKFEEANKYAYHLSLIIVDSAEKANKVKTLLKNKNDFEQVASEHCSDEDLRKSKGFVEQPVPDGQMRPQMLRVVKSLVDNGYSSEPIQIDSKYIFVKKRLRQQATMPPLDDRMRKEIVRALEGQAFTKILHGLVKDAKIEAFDTQGKPITNFNLEADLSAAMKAASGERPSMAAGA